ncbi:MAG: phosphorylase [Phycisphaerales bacterium]|nr:phosphorylase [Phycisphaerales bacterium]
MTAVEIEAKAVARALGLVCPRPKRPAQADRAGATLELHLIGIAAERLPSNLRSDESAIIIMAGLAGGLDPSLRVGDVVIDDCPPGLLPDVAHRRGGIQTANHIIATTTEKAELFAQTGALAVDMETRIVRRSAERAGAQFIAIRAISDAFDEALDPTILKLVDGFGRPRPTAIATTLLCRPALIAPLRRLGAASHLAAENLGAAVESIVARFGEVEAARSAE